jgi:hypothetical protein
VIPIAADKIESFCIFLAARGTPSPVMAVTGNLHPIIPLYVMNEYLQVRIWFDEL